MTPTDHPLRSIQKLVNESPTRLNGLFNTIYADAGRASIAPEKLVRALLLQAIYSIFFDAHQSRGGLSGALAEVDQD